MNFRFVCVFVASISAMTPSAAWASDWRYVTSSSSDTDIFIDVSSARELIAVPYKRPFKVRQSWVKYDHTNDKTRKERTTKHLILYNCNSETSNMVSSINYRADGTVIDSGTFLDYESNYKPLVPDSVNYAIFEIVCGRTSLPEQ